MPKPWTSDDAPGLLTLAGILFLMGAIIWPVGEFPLNDDWSYARAVQTTLETGLPRFTGWTSLPLIAQTLWGALFCLPAGFSFASLRLSTAVAGLLGAWGLFALMRAAGRDRPTAFAAALVLALNPLYVNLSHTFMTDVPFTAATLCALTGFLRAFSDPRPRWLWLGFLAGLAATLTRHTGLILPLAFFLATLLGPPTALRTRAAIAAAATAAALLAFCAFASAHLGLRPFWTSQGAELAAGLAAPLPMLARAGEITLTLGLFLLPFECFLRSSEPRPRAAWAFPLAAAAALGLVALGIRLPLSGNILHAAGLGPVRLADVATLGLPHLPPLPAGAWTLATGLGVAGALLAACRWITPRRPRAPVPLASRQARLFLALCAAGLLAPMLVAGYMDRYLLPLLPLALLALPPAPPAHAPRSPAWLAAAALSLLLLGAFAAAATHDYFSWNRARWSALDDLVDRQRIPPSRIDGGFEFNGSRLFDPAHPADRLPPPDKSWWWVDDDEYVIALGPIPGYAAQARHPFPRWLGPSPGQLLVLRREAP